MTEAARKLSQTWEENAWDQRTLEWLAGKINETNFVQVHSKIGKALHSSGQQHLAPIGWWADLIQATPITAIDLPAAPEGTSLEWRLIHSYRNHFTQVDIIKIRLSNLRSVMSQIAPISEADWLNGYTLSLEQPLRGGDLNLDLNGSTPGVWSAASMTSLNPSLPKLDIFAYPGSLLSPYQLVAQESLKGDLTSEYQMNLAVNLAGNPGASSQQLNWFMDLLEEKVPRVQGDFESSSGLGPFYASVAAAFVNNPNYLNHHLVESLRSTEPWIFKTKVFEAGGWKNPIPVAKPAEAGEESRLEPFAGYRDAVRNAMHVVQDKPEASTELEYAAKYSFLIGSVFAELEDEMGVDRGSMPTAWLAELL